MDQEYQTQRVPDSATIAWWRIALANIAFGMSLPSFVAGLELVKAAPAQTVIWGTILGGLFLSAVAVPMGVIGASTRLSSYLLARIAFGQNASTALNLAFAFSLLGWFGVNIELFGRAMLELQDQAGVSTIPLWSLQAAGGLLMTLLTFLGLKAISKLSLLITPLMMLATVLMVMALVQTDTVGSILASGVPTGLTLGEVLSATVGFVVVGAVIMPDTCRFVRTRAGGIGVAVGTYLVSTPLVLLAAGLAGLASGQTELLPLMFALGLGLGAFAIVFGGTTTLNSLNLYSAALAVQAAAPALKRVHIVLLGGIGGTLFAFAGILDNFIPFLTYLTVIFIPVGAIVLCDFFLIRRDAYFEEDLNILQATRPDALLAWSGGSGIAFLAMNGLITLSGIVAVDALLVATVVYLAANRVLPKGKRRAMEAAR